MSERRVGASLKDAPAIALRAISSPTGVIALVAAILAVVLLPNDLKFFGFPVALAIFGPIMMRQAAIDDRRVLSAAAREPSSSLRVDVIVCGDSTPYPTRWRQGSVVLCNEDTLWQPRNGRGRASTLDFRALGARVTETRDVTGSERWHIKGKFFRILDCGDGGGHHIRIVVPIEAVGTVAAHLT